MATTTRLVVCGREFAPGDLVIIRRIISAESAPNRSQIARRTCEALRWLRPDGRLKEMSCRVALLRLEKLGLLCLPPPLTRNGNGKPYRIKETLVCPDEPIRCGIGKFAKLDVIAVQSTKASRVWNEAIARFHYLGHKPLPGAQIRYLIESDRGILGAIGFGASAWKVASRDRWIGWDSEQRRERLHLILNNARFLVLPWVRSRNLSSWVLSRVARRIPQDFEDRYGYRPVLLETFVERDRFRGTCYEAANWLYLGDTQGRGKLDRHHRRAVAIKKVYVYPLITSFRHMLGASDSS